MDTLLVSHIPRSLTYEDVKDFFMHFGASSIKYYGIKGHMKNKAHVFYSKPEEAEIALRRLHQLEILGSRLIAEYAAPKNIKSYTDTSKDSDFQINSTEKKEFFKESNDIDEMPKKISREINSISHYWNFEYPINPELRYSYPLPTVTILTNIANALASVPKFYVQVLHLMNKMNLPAPFGSFNLPVTTKTPEISEELESEIESDSEICNDSRKRRLRQKKILKVPKLNLLNFHSMSVAPSHTGCHDRDEIFEKSTTVSANAKKIDIVVSNDVELRYQDPIVDPPLSGPGFGKIYPNIKDDTNLDSEDKTSEWCRIEFIRKEELLNNRISEKEMKTMSIYKNYSAGDPTIRLYIKNLSKKVLETDLHFIYGAYVNWDLSEEKIMYDIRLMKEGKMKGQGFITLPNIEAATLALNQTNGYLLLDKPMVVCFARSAKSKISL